MTSSTLDIIPYDIQPYDIINPWFYKAMNKDNVVLPGQSLQNSCCFNERGAHERGTPTHPQTEGTRLLRQHRELQWICFKFFYFFCVFCILISWPPFVNHLTFLIAPACFSYCTSFDHFVTNPAPFYLPGQSMVYLGGDRLPHLSN